MEKMKTLMIYNFQINNFYDYFQVFIQIYFSHFLWRLQKIFIRLQVSYI